jgi:hypothetical protein
MARPPTSTGSSATTTLPKITSSRTSAMGKETASASWRSEFDSALIAASVVTVPPIWLVRPGIARSCSILVYAAGCWLAWSR